MRWIEIIQLRTTSEAGLDLLIEELGRAMEDEPIEGAIYRHATLATDLSVLLVHETDGAARPDRSMGQRLVAALEEHGLVHRSLWVDAQTTARKEGRPS